MRLSVSSSKCSQPHHKTSLKTGLSIWSTYQVFSWHCLPTTVDDIITQPGVSALNSQLSNCILRCIWHRHFYPAGSDMIGSQKDKAERNWITILKETWQQLTDDNMDYTKKIKTMLGFAVVCTAVYTDLQDLLPCSYCRTHFYPRTANTTFLVLMLVANITEQYQLKSFGKFFDFKYSSDGQSEKNNRSHSINTAALVVSFIVLNALGNGIIGLGVVR